VLGVDDVLLAVVRQRVGAGRPEPHAMALGEREQAAARFLLLGARVGDVQALARADLDLRGDQLAGDRVGQHRVAHAGVAQVLETRDQLQRLGIEERPLLLDADRQVLGDLEGLARGGKVDQVR
jgi:hypothetical protein